MQWNGIGDDGVNPPVTFALVRVGGDDDDLQAKVQALNDETEAGNPGYSFTFEYPRDPDTFYIFMDKPSVIALADGNGNYGCWQSAAVYGTGAIPPFLPCLMNPEDTPRNTGWFDIYEEHKEQG